MAGHAATTSPDERLVLGEEVRPLITVGRNLGVIGIVGAAVKFHRDPAAPGKLLRQPNSIGGSALEPMRIRYQ